MLARWLALQQSVYGQVSSVMPGIPLPASLEAEPVVYRLALVAWAAASAQQVSPALVRQE